MSKCMSMQWKWHIQDTVVDPEGRRRVCPSFTVLTMYLSNEWKVADAVRRRLD